MFEEGTGQQRSRNYIRHLGNLVGNYPSLVHGLQKDAIQNAMDARASKRQPCIVEFELIENKNGCFLIITDKNTKGLRGPHRNQLSPPETEQNYSEEDDADWIRWEMGDVTKIDKNALGSRGQGKFIIAYCSDDIKMAYDTLRVDGVYRFGGMRITKTTDEVYPPKGEGVWENEVAEKKLAEYCGLSRLTENGTRVIISEPKEEILDAIADGTFKKAIQETWFPAIEKKQLEVYIITNGNSQKVTLTDTPCYEIKSEKTKSWIIDENSDNRTIKAGGKTYKIKRFEAHYNPDKNLDEDWQGIAIIQGGMKICSTPGNPLPAEKAEKIWGRIEFERELDQELREGENQHTTHYNLNWLKAIPKAIKLYVNSQLDEFGDQKLGSKHLEEKTSAQDKKTQKKVDEGIGKIIDIKALNVGFLSEGGMNGSTTPNRGATSSSPSKGYGIEIKVDHTDSKKWPRIDWQEQIICCLAVHNNTSEDMLCTVSLRIHRSDKEIKTLYRKSDILIPANSNYSPKDNPFIVSIDKSIFSSKGQYRIKANLIPKGEKKKSDTIEFWVEQDPPPKNNFPFDLIGSPLDYPLPWKIKRDKDNKLKLFYNTKHPDFEKTKSNETAREDYFLYLKARGFLRFFVLDPAENETPYSAFDLLDLDMKSIKRAIESGDPIKVYEATEKFLSALEWKYYERGQAKWQ